MIVNLFDYLFLFISKFENFGWNKVKTKKPRCPRQFF